MYRMEKDKLEDEDNKNIVRALEAAEVVVEEEAEDVKLYFSENTDVEDMIEEWEELRKLELQRVLKRIK